MNISKKIEEIRREPEHIRLRYVWGAVAICMFFIVAIWIFSIGSLFQGDENPSQQINTNAPDINEQLQDLKQQAPSIKDFADPLTAVSEGITAQKNTKTDDFKYPAETTTTEIPKASTYSDLTSENSEK